MTSSITSLLCFAFVALAHAQPIVVGAVISQSGMHADLAAGYTKGIQLWEAEVNAAGGLLGRPVELRILDDGSDELPVREQRGRLVTTAQEQDVRVETIDAHEGDDVARYATLLATGTWAATYVKIGLGRA